MTPQPDHDLPFPFEDFETNQFEILLRMGDFFLRYLHRLRVAFDGDRPGHFGHPARGKAAAHIRQVSLSKMGTSVVLFRCGEGEIGYLSAFVKIDRLSN